MIMAGKPGIVASSVGTFPDLRSHVASGFLRLLPATTSRGCVRTTEMVFLESGRVFETWTSEQVACEGECEDECTYKSRRNWLATVRSSHYVCVLLYWHEEIEINGSELVLPWRLGEDEENEEER